MRKFNKVFLRLLLPALWLLYFISGFLSRNKNFKVYGSPGNRFSDNAKYAYLEASKKKSKKEVICWITGDKKLVRALNARGLMAVHRWSCKGIFFGLVAGEYHFSTYSSDINFWTSKGSININYWHGVPFKKIEHDIHSGPLKTRYNPSNIVERMIFLVRFICSPAASIRPNYLYSPHSYFDEFFMSAFRVKKSALIRKEYPRVSFLKQSSREINGVEYIGSSVSAIEKNHHDLKLGLYVPTFRDASRNWVSENFLIHSDLIQLVLERKNIKLLIKPHPNEILKSSVSYPNIQIIDSQMDTYNLMRDVDFIITDYSSIAVDAAEYGLDVFLLWPDLLEYKEKSRDFYFDIQSFYNNKYFSSVQDMINSLEDNEFYSMNVKTIICNK